jgi:EAL domain-containing protein (putative c-di-GMP-specific phosphodiesterase class I)
MSTRALLLLGFSVLIAIFVATLALGLGRLLRDGIRDAALSGAEQTGQLFAELEIGEEEFDGLNLAADTPEDLDAVVEESDSLRVARLWGPAGHLLYASDRESGRVEPKGDALRKAFGGRIASRVSGGAEAERILTIYVPIALPGEDQPRSVLELHLPYAPVQAAIDYRTRNLTAVVVLTALLFYLALLPSVLRGSRALADIYDARQIPLQRRLRRAMRDGEIDLHYQPKLELSSGRIDGVEALLRWRLKDGSIVSAADYIPLIEATPVMQDVTMHVYERAVGQSARWAAQGIDIRVAVNISICNLRESEFPERLAQVTAAHGRSPRDFTLEVTESTVGEDARLEARTLKELRARGFTISIDDFGTGESSLGRVDSAEFQEVKIDRSFLRKLDVDPTVVAGIINLAHALGARTVAEGVETGAAARQLGDLGCDVIQGFHVAPPLPADELFKWLCAFRTQGKISSSAISA